MSLDDQQATKRQNNRRSDGINEVDQRLENCLPTGCFELIRILFFNDILEATRLFIFRRIALNQLNFGNRPLKLIWNLRTRRTNLGVRFTNACTEETNCHKQYWERDANQQSQLPILNKQERQNSHERKNITNNAEAIWTDQVL